MYGVIRNLAVITTAFVLAMAGLTGCATTAPSIGNSDELAQFTATTADTVVFGKFRLVRNGQEANLGSGLFANSATLHLYQTDADQEIVGEVGEGGEFAWVLPPGHYRLSSIDFKNRGERAVTPTNFEFAVSPGQQAVYIGTITMEATFESGYLGLNGVVDRYIVSNDCAADCAGRLAQLGMPTDAASVRLAQQMRQVALTY